MKSDQLDATSIKILNLLQQDGRMSTTKLAEILNLSRSAVQDRVRNLETSGVIQGYSATISPLAMQQMVQAVLTISITVRPCATVLARLEKFPQIERLYSIAGEKDAVAIVNLGTPDELTRLIDQFSQIEGVGQLSSTVVLKRIL